MKYLFSLFVLFVSTLASAQTPSLYDTWTPTVMGSIVHLKITEHQIIVFHSSSGFEKNMPQFLTVPVPQDNSSVIQQETKSEPLLEKSDTSTILKIVYDSAKVKGRIFFSTSKNSSNILALTFLLSDDGEMQLGFAFDKRARDKTPKNLKEAEKMTRQSSITSTSNGLRFPLYNSKRSSEFSKLKNPTAIPKSEILVMINSFGNRMTATLQQIPLENISASLDYHNYNKMMMPLYNNFLRITHELFVVHGYNPLAAATIFDRLKSDPELDSACDDLGEKIQNVIPLFREEKRLRDSSTEARKNEELIPYGSDEAGIAEARKLMDLKSPVYDATATLTKEQTDNLLKKISDYKTSEQVQINAVIVSSLHGNTPEKAARMIGDWNKTTRRSPNGSTVIFLAKNDHKGYIATGGGMGIIPDSSIQEIFDGVLTPKLKDGNYYEGIDKTIDAVIAKSKTSSAPSYYEVMHRSDNETSHTVDSTMTATQSSGVAPAPAPPSPTGEVHHMHKSSVPLWHTNLNEALAEAKATKKNIFIDFTGYTCTNSRAMESTIFNKAEVMGLLRNYIQVRLYTDDGSAENDANRKLEEERFKTIAQPYYVILSPDNTLLASFPGYTRDQEAFVNFLTPYAKNNEQK